MTNAAHTHGKANWAVCFDLDGGTTQMMETDLSEYAAYDIALEFRTTYAKYLRPEVARIFISNGDRFEVVWSR